MYDKNTITSLIQTSRELDSIVIPKTLSQTEKTRVLDKFNKSVKTKLNAHEIVLVALKM